MLSIGGRSVLITLVLGSLGNYYMSLFVMPLQVKKWLESLHEKLFWAFDGSSKRLSWVNWNMVLASKRKVSSVLAALRLLTTL